MVKQVRDKKIDKGKGQSRSLAEVRAFLEGLTGPGENSPLREFAEEFLKFVQDKIKDETMEKRLRKLLGQGQCHEPQNAKTLPEAGQDAPAQDARPVDGPEPPASQVA